jgi:hypothetical protein
MKSIIKSVSPKIAVNVLNGSATILVAKTIPTLKPPYEMYLYVSKVNNDWFNGFYSIDNGELGFTPCREYSCDEEYSYYKNKCRCDGKVVAKVTVEEVEEIREYSVENNKYYTENNILHLTSLVIFAKPKEIGEFNKCDGFIDCFNCSKYKSSENKGVNCKFRKLTKAPSNFCYVEVEE